MAGPLLVVATLELGFVILIESGLSFLGLGTPPEIPSWGGMLQEGRALINIAWWLTTFPGLAIMLTSLWVLLLLIPVLIILQRGVVAPEEAYLERQFGEAYRKYKARVPRWL